MASVSQVFELGGDAVLPAMAAGLTRLIAEGSGAEGGGEGDTHMRSKVVASYMDLLTRPKLSDVLLTVGTSSDVLLCVCLCMRACVRGSQQRRSSMVARRIWQCRGC